MSYSRYARVNLAGILLARGATAAAVEMLEASRQYRNMIEAMSTAKQLMLETMRMK